MGSARRHIEERANTTAQQMIAQPALCDEGGKSITSERASECAGDKRQSSSGRETHRTPSLRGVRVAVEEEIKINSTNNSKARARMVHR